MGESVENLKLEGNLSESDHAMIDFMTLRKGEQNIDSNKKDLKNLTYKERLKSWACVALRKED